MSMNYKNILLTVKNGEEINKVFVQTSAHNVIVDKETGETLKQRLAKIAKQLGDQGLTVTEQVQEVKDQVAALIQGAPEALDSLAEVSAYIQNNREEIDALKVVAEGIEKAIDDALETKVGDLGEYKTVAEFVEAKMAADEVRCLQAIAAEASRAKAAEEANAVAIGENRAAVEAETLRAVDAENVLDKKIEGLFNVFESVDAFDPEKIGDKGMSCIFLPDDPVEVEDEAGLIAAIADENPSIVLTSDIVVNNDIDLSAKEIMADGYVIEAASQDVVITL